MKKTIEFWFDFSSPYSYLAGEQIEALATKHDCAIDWQPVLVGAIFKATGSAPLTMRHAALAEYSKNDFLRSARYGGIAYSPPDPFPIASQNTARAALWIKAHQPEALARFIRACMRGLFVDNAPINDLDWIAKVCQSCGADSAGAVAACEDSYYKDLLRKQVESALAKGIFGVPWMIADGEPFWGNDRLPQLDRWLAQGKF